MNIIMIGQKYTVMQKETANQTELKSDIINLTIIVFLLYLHILLYQQLNIVNTDHDSITSTLQGYTVNQFIQ